MPSRLFHRLNVAFCKKSASNRLYLFFYLLSDGRYANVAASAALSERRAAMLSADLY